MLNRQEHIYRLTYEAFSQFSSRITRTRTFDEVLQCLKLRVKYLFDYSLLRVNFRYEQSWVDLTLDGERSNINLRQSPQLYPFEEELREKGIPKLWTAPDHPEVFLKQPIKTGLQQIWGWHFRNTDQRDITVVIGVGEEQSFNKKSIPFVKLFIEILEAKLLELVLFAQLQEKNAYIQANLDTIEEKNNEIQAIVEQQDQVIQRQTQHLKERNAKLVEISVFNAHKVREPLSRILGLSNLIREMDNKAEATLSIIPMLLQSSEELDTAVRGVIDISLNDLNNT